MDNVLTHLRFCRTRYITVEVPITVECLLIYLISRRTFPSQRVSGPNLDIYLFLIRWYQMSIISMPPFLYTTRLMLSHRPTCDSFHCIILIPSRCAHEETVASVSKTAGSTLKSGLRSIPSPRLSCESHQRLLSWRGMNFGCSGGTPSLLTTFYSKGRLSLTWGN